MIKETDKSQASIKITRRRKVIGRTTSILALCAVIFIAAGLYSALETTGYTVESKRLPPEFDGFRIVLLSDFHLQSFGDREKELIDAIWEAEPDMIALAGDIIDRGKGSMDSVRELLEGIYGRVPVYGSVGNHELENADRFRELRELYSLHGVVFLDNSSAEIRRDAASIRISAPKTVQKTPGSYWIDFSQPGAGAGSYNILLNHYGDKFDDAAPYGYDLVLSGHVHGGIVRTPFTRGIFGNDCLFPKYDAGMYICGQSAMILSRGLGDAGIPRLYNRRELVVITLKSSANVNGN